MTRKSTYIWRFMPYAKWINIAGMLIVFLLMVDYFIPYQSRQENITEVETVRKRRGSFSHYRIHMNPGRSLHMHTRIGEAGEALTTSRTRIYGIAMHVQDAAGFGVTLGRVYSFLLILPAMLLISSLFGIAMRKDPGQSFNTGVVSLVMIIITIYLIY